MRYHKIPDETVRRLPIYLRGLMFSAEKGHEHISSQSLAAFVGVHSWQIRKDFSYFGDFGTLGVGYNIGKLAKEIQRILRLDVIKRAALIGVGDLGSALLAYPGFRTYGLDIVAAFDADPEKVGSTVNGVEIEDASGIDSLAQRGIFLAIVAVPRQAAQETVDRLVAAGIKGGPEFRPMQGRSPQTSQSHYSGYRHGACPVAVLHAGELSEAAQNTDCVGPRCTSGLRTVFEAFGAGIVR